MLFRIYFYSFLLALLIGCIQTDNKKNNIKVSISENVKDTSGQKASPKAEEYNDDRALNTNEKSVSIFYESSCEYGTNNAILDAKKGIYKMYSYGLPFNRNWDFETFYEAFILEKYGIETGNMGCVIEENTKCYQTKMRELIYLKFGINIFYKAYAEAQEAYKLQIKTKIDTGFVFMSVDKEVEFNGGNDSLNKYLTDHLDFTTEFVGTISVNFVVEKDGSVGNVYLEKECHCEIDSKLISIFKNMPKWSPALIFGQPVRVRRIVPVEFGSDD